MNGFFLVSTSYFRNRTIYTVWLFNKLPFLINILFLITEGASTSMLANLFGEYTRAIYLIPRVLYYSENYYVPI